MRPACDMLICVQRNRKKYAVSASSPVALQSTDVCETRLTISQSCPCSFRLSSFVIFSYVSTEHKSNLFKLRSHGSVCRHRRSVITRFSKSIARLANPLPHPSFSDLRGRGGMDSVVRVYLFLYEPFKMWVSQQGPFFIFQCIITYVSAIALDELDVTHVFKLFAFGFCTSSFLK